MVIRHTISARQHRALGLLSVLSLVLGYAALSCWQHVVVNPNDTTIPTFFQMWDGLRQVVMTHPREHTRWLVVDALASGERLFLALGIGLTSAFVVGIAMGCFRSVGAFFAPPLSFLASIPPTGMLSVFLAMCGFGIELYTAMIVFGVLPGLAQAIYLGTKDVQDEEVWKAYTLGGSHIEVIWHVVVRKLAPRVLDAMCLQIGPAVVYLLATETLYADLGFGYRIRMHAKLSNMHIVLPYLAIAAGFTSGVKFALGAIRTRRYPWFDRGGAA